MRRIIIKLTTTALESKQHSHQKGDLFIIFLHFPKNIKSIFLLFVGDPLLRKIEPIFKSSFFRAFYIIPCPLQK